MKKYKILISAICLLSISLFSVYMASAGSWSPSIEYKGHTVNADLTVTYCYEVTSPSSPSLSHWALQLCIPSEASIISVSETPWDYDYNTKPDWLKFDLGYTDGEKRTVCFTLDMFYPVSEIDWEAKGGGETASGTIMGPGCDGFEIPEVPFGTLGAVGIVGLAIALFAVYRRQTPITATT